MDKEYRTTLPGGLVIKGLLEKEASFKPLNGHLELRLAETVSLTEDIPSKVTDILFAAVNTIGNTPVDKKMITDLCVPDRQYLMMKLYSLYCQNPCILIKHLRTAIKGCPELNRNNMIFYMKR